MPDTTSGRVLLTLNTRLTGKYGKSLRFIKLAELFDSMGMNVNMMVSESNFKMEKPRFSIIKTRVNLDDTSSYRLPAKIVYYAKQSTRLFSLYLKVLFCGDRYNVIVTSNVNPPLDPLLAFFLSKCMKIPFIYDYDDLVPEGATLSMNCGKWNPYIIVLLQLERVLCSSSRLTLVMSEKMKRVVSRSVNPRKMVVLYNTVSGSTSTQPDAENTRFELSLPRHKTIISYAGLIKPKRLGIEELLRAFSRVDCDVREKILILLIGPIDEYIQNMIRQLGLQSNVWSLGPLERREALSVLRMSSLSIIPSPPPPIGNVMAPTKLFEAMSLGLPILAPKVGEYEQILGKEYPYYYDCTPNGLEYALRSVLNDGKSLKVVGEKLRKLFEEKYSWERHKEQLLPIISDFLPELCS